MLKKRLVGVLPIKNGIVVQSIGFRKYLPVGKPKIAVEYLNRWGIDEIVLLDLDATREKRTISPALVREVSKYTQAPLTAGGGIKSLEDMKVLISSGADKLSLNSILVDNAEVLDRGAQVFGHQCMVASIDVRKKHDGRYEVFRNSGSDATGLDAVQFAKSLEKSGAGELFVNSVDHDGSKQGYDLELLKLVSAAVAIPVIACGGVGNVQHFVEGLNIQSLSALAAGNFFHFTEHSVAVAKSVIAKQGLPIRLDSSFNYKENQADEFGRILKKADSELAKLFFEYHPKEVI